MWEVEFSGAYTGAANLTFAYDPTVLPAGFDESTLSLRHFIGGAWQGLAGVVNALAHTITVSTTTLGPFALGVDGGVTFQIAARV